jgi:ribosomal protein S27AE
VEKRYCKKCGRPLDIGDIDCCKGCTEEQNKENYITICPKCGQKNHINRTTCKSCGAELYGNKVKQTQSFSNSNENYYTENTVASIIKGIAILLAIIGIIASICIAGMTENIVIGIVGSIISILSVLLLYAVGEIIEIMHDVRTNSEHIRDYLENSK